MKELFNVTSSSDDDDAIMKSFIGYAQNLKNELEKLEIAKGHLISKQIKLNGLKDEQASFEDP